MNNPLKQVINLYVLHKIMCIYFDIIQLIYLNNTSVELCYSDFSTSEVILQQPREQVFYFYSTTVTKRAKLFPL